MAPKKNKKLSSLQTYINLNYQESEDSTAAASAAAASASEAAVVAANGSDKETDGGVTYFVGEDGHYYYQPSKESQNLDPLPTYVSEGTGEATDGSSADKIGYPTTVTSPISLSEGTNVTILVPSESEIGEVSVLVVQDDEKPEGIDIDDNLGDDNQDNESSNAVYNFGDDEPEDEIQDKDVIKSPSLPSEEIKRGYLRQQFTCFCSYTSYKRYLLLRHMKSHSKEKPHKCLICERGFMTTMSLQNHVNIHNGVKPHICKHCNSTFRTSSELVRHVKYRHTHEKLHKCNECDYACVELSKLKRHIRFHTGERPYQCPHCTYAATDTFKLKRHLRTHTGEKPYKCDLCHMFFTQANSLKVHKLIHNVSETPVFACELCPAKCRRKTDLRIHVQKMHTSDKPLKCNKCGKSFPDKYTCKMHNKTHEGEKCFKCGLCPYASTTLRLLRSHTLKHTDEKPFACNLCEQCFKQKQLLRRHQNLYHNPNYSQKPPKEKTHTCHECSRTFAHKGNLIRHLAIHDPESGYHERALALRLGQQKKVITVNRQIKRQINDSDNKEMGAKMINEEILTVSGGDGQQFVVLEVIQLPDATEQQVAVVAPECITEEDQDMEEGEGEMDEDTLIDQKKILDFKKGEDRKMLERSNKLEKDVDTCFGFNDEEEPEDDINFDNDSAVLSII